VSRSQWLVKQLGTKCNCKRLFVCNGRLIKGDPFSLASPAGSDEGVDESRLAVLPRSGLDGEIF
jgi:hypothetical protein